MRIQHAGIDRQLTTHPATGDTDGTPLAKGKIAAAAGTAIRSTRGFESVIQPRNGLVHVNTSPTVA